MSRFLEALEQRVLVFDGAMGTALHALDLPQGDREALERCPELLNATNPAAVGGVHAAYLAAGADAVETNTFGCTRLLLGEHGLADRTAELNQRAVAIARAACDQASAPDRPRFVVGSMGPGTRLPSLGQIAFGALKAAYREQAAALIEAGVDALLLETAQDVLQVKAGLAGIRAAQAELGSVVPVMAQVTVETTGTLLVGTDLPAAVAALEPFDLCAVGLNCATGPRQMAPHVAWLGRHSRKNVSVLPNAGLPELKDGRAHYPLQPEEFADWLERFVEEDGVAIVGGCCGTTPAHIAAVARLLSGRPRRPRPVAPEPSLSSLYGAVPLRQDADILAIGERANANGSAACRRALMAEDWEAVVALARAQVAHGSHALDICTAVVGRDERADMIEVVSRLRTAVRAPLMIDSTDPAVLEDALELLAGRSVINSVNLEAGEARADHICAIAREHGAALVALTIDEQGMARTPERKLAVAERLIQIAVERHGLAPSALLIDPLTFTVCTGQEADRPLAAWTLEGIRRIRARFPEVGIVLGVSNVSFGLQPRARAVLSSVFLHLAREAGLTAAIVHARGVLPLFSIPDELRRAAEDLLLDRRDASPDPLQRFMALCAPLEGAADGSAPVHADETLEQRLVRRVVEGLRAGLEEDLAEALTRHPPLTLINSYLLEGMRVVGEHFAAGRTQLPFVLQSAEVVKAAVSWLEPHMDKAARRARGRMVLATVRGDVHDIGKNLVEILLTNNGYQVVDLGIRQPVAALLEAVRAHEPDAIGLSGLLVRSTAVMREDLIELRRQGITTPVILGGAALTRAYVEGDCSAAYGQPVGYAGNAFDGLAFMDELERAREAGLPSRWAQPLHSLPPLAHPEPAEQDDEPDGLPDSAAWDRVPALALPPGEPGPLPPPGLAALVPLLDRTTLFRFRWGFRAHRPGTAAWEQEREVHLEPLLADLLARVEAAGWAQPAVARGYFPCHAEGERLALALPGGGSLRLTAPRGQAIRGLGAWFPPPDEPPDLAGLLVATLGDAMVEAARAHYTRGAYRDYLLLHGLAQELTEALAAWLHRLMRQELGIGGDDDPDPARSLRGKHRGRRYAFGFPALPELQEQRPVLEALRAADLGVHLSPGGQLSPILTTTALVVAHPRARYYRV
ncbi:MAG: methionine synthase [Pseudomonadota bacterium]